MKIATDGYEFEERTLTELRVHGVGGASPAETLDVPHARLVAGTARAGFYRAAPWIPVPGPTRHLEGYSWGGLTSRARSRAAWIILLPFALINLAGFMFPHSGTPTEPTRPVWTDRTAAGLFRLLALAATAATAAFTGLIFIDLVGVRCRCDPWYLAPWTWWTSQVDGEQRTWDAIEGAALGAAVAVLVLGVVALAARLGQAQSDRADTSIRDDPTYRDRLTRTGPGAAITSSGAFWRRPDVTHRLGLAHSTVAALVVALMTTETVTSLGGPSDTLRWLSYGALAVIGIEVVLVASLSLAPGRAHQLLAVLGITITSASLVIAWRLPAVNDPASVEGHVTDVPRAVFALMGLAFLAVWLLEIVRAIGDHIARVRSPDTLVPSTTVPTRISLSFLGLGLVAAVGAGIYLSAADLLDVAIRGEAATNVALAAAAWVAAVIAALGWCWLRSNRRPLDELLSQWERSTVDVEQWRDRRWLKRVAAAEAMAKLTDRVGAVLLAGTVAALGVLAISQFGAFARIDDIARWAARALALVPLGGILVMRYLIRSPDARRGFGIIWDVATFWPRWFHPWAPPSYGEHAIPHLTEYLRVAARRGPVILSAHSQGTVLSLAALGVADADAVRQVRFVTHGCPLHRLYARFFPEYFGQELFGEIRERLDPSRRWCNLFRRTDYIGGKVFTDVHPRWEDLEVTDPESSERDLDVDPRPPPLRHSNFYVTNAYADVLVAFSDGGT